MSGMRITRGGLKIYLFTLLCILFIPGQTVAAGGVKFNLPKSLQQNVRKYPGGVSVKIAAIRVEFPEDDEEGTTGNGRFDLSDTDTLDFDPPPHDKRYFKAHIRALSNYYSNVSRGSVIIDTASSSIFPEGDESSYQLSNPMRYYSPKIDQATDDNRLAKLFYESVTAAAPDVDFSSYDCVTIFHAGVGKDFTFQLDLTPFDIPSAFLDPDFLRDNLSAEEYSRLQSLGVERGLILPETQTQEGFNIALNGTFALLFGSFLGIPSLWDTDTGNPGIGKWGLMDQGSNNMNGAVPARPSAFTRMFMGWENPVPIRTGFGLQLFAFSDLIIDSMYFSYKIPISSNEYFLIENRRNKRTAADNEGFEQIIVGRDTAYVEFDPAGSGVIIRAAEYDAGIPGSGLLIWHIDGRVVNEKYSTNRINTDINNRGVSLEEGDGSEDIGHEFGFLEPGGGSEVGSPWDAFYAGNPAWYFQNSDWTPDADSTVAFTIETNPNSRSNRGGYTGISITKISRQGSVMTFDLTSDLLVDGFPFPLEDINLESKNSPAVADFDGDGVNEIFMTLPNGAIQIITMRNGLFEPYNSHRKVFANLADSVEGSILVTDLGGNDSLEIIVAGINGIVRMFEHEINTMAIPFALPVWSVDIGSEIRATPLVAEGDIYVGGVDGSVRKIDYEGNILSTFFGGSTVQSMVYSAYTGVIRFHENMVTGPIYGEDGMAFTVSEDGIIWLRNIGPDEQRDLDSTRIIHFRYDTGDLILSSPALADIDADGDLELIITGNNKLWAFNSNLSLVANFPITIDNQNPVGQIQSSPVVGDVDGDGLPDIVFGAPNGLVYGYHGDGSLVDGFPLSTGGSVNSTPVIDDVIPGGPIEVVVASEDGYLYMWTMLEDAEINPVLPWPTFAGNNERTNYAPSSTFAPHAANEELMESSKVFAYPNPAEGNETRIRYFVGEVSSVQIMIFDMAGEYIGTLQDNHIRRNEYNEIIWDVSSVSSGIYLARVNATGADGSSASKVIKIAVVK